MQKVLAEIGARDLPQLLVFNKLDALPPERQPLAVEDSYEVDGQAVPRLFVSARSGQGMDLLRQALARRVREHLPTHEAPLDDPRALGRNSLDNAQDRPADFGTM